MRVQYICKLQLVNLLDKLSLAIRVIHIDTYSMDMYVQNYRNDKLPDTIRQVRRQ